MKKQFMITPLFLIPMLVMAEGYPYNSALPSDFKPSLTSTLPSIQLPRVKIQQPVKAVAAQPQAVAIPQKTKSK